VFNPFKRLFAAQEPPPNSKVSDSYAEKLVKYIPADILAAYIAISGITESNNPPLWLSWGVFGVLLALTPLYVCYVKTAPAGFVASKMFHWLTACLAFTAFVFAVGGPFATFAWYQPYLGSVVLILTTLIIPVLEGQFYPGNTPVVPPAEPPVVPPAADPATPAEPPNSQP
jgi:hypothetical protein